MVTDPIEALKKARLWCTKAGAIIKGGRSNDVGGNLCDKFKVRKGDMKKDP